MRRAGTIRLIAGDWLAVAAMLCMPGYTQSGTSSKESAPAKSAALIALDDALEDLAKMDPRKAQVVEMRYFGGLSVEEAAEALHVHPNTVIRDWNMAKVWLKHELTRGKSAHAG